MYVHHQCSEGGSKKIGYFECTEGTIDWWGKLKKAAERGEVWLAFFLLSMAGSFGPSIVLWCPVPVRLNESVCACIKDYFYEFRLIEVRNVVAERGSLLYWGQWITKVISFFITTHPLPQKEYLNFSERKGSEPKYRYAAFLILPNSAVRNSSKLRAK